MSMSGSEILKVVAYPFRIYNINELDIDTFIFSLSFQAFEDCNITIAKKILYLAIEQDKIKRTNNKIIANFDPWAIKVPFNWKPVFKGLENVPEVELEALPEIPLLEIKPNLAEIDHGESISEPFQFESRLIKHVELKEQKVKLRQVSEEEVKVKPIRVKKIREEPRKAKKQVKKTKKKEAKQKTLLETPKKVKKVKNKVKTLTDFM